jgi:hypothetical protein
MLLSVENQRPEGFMTIELQETGSCRAGAVDSYARSVAKPASITRIAGLDGMAVDARRLAIRLLIVGIALPPLYLFVMIQYSAVTLPFMDHLATAKLIVKYFDGNLTFSDLIGPHNQARPLFPRLIFIANAALTDWDIRSEFLYIYLTIYGTLAALLVALWRISGEWSKTVTLTTAVLISAIACSPVGSNNHFWSLMLFETLSYLCAIVALLVVSLNPTSRAANISAAALAWIAGYSISQGLLVFPAILVMHQLMAGRLKPTRWSVFWLVNMVVCYATYFYLPGAVDAGARPTVSEFLAFIPIYVGNPLGTLLWFSASILSTATTTINGICGALILVVTAITAWHAWPELGKRPEARIFFSFVAFASATAIVTAWGRASGPESISSANSSRYSIFAACFLFGLIFYYAATVARKEMAFTVWHRIALCLFLVAATITYVRAVPTYTSYHGYDGWLAEAYPPNAEPTDVDIKAFPNLEYFRPIKADLLRLHIGPYRIRK